jgi:hypothetical protein
MFKKVQKKKLLSGHKKIHNHGKFSQDDKGHRISNPDNTWHMPKYSKIYIKKYICPNKANNKYAHCA